MGFLGLFRRLDRRHWFMCNDCMNQSNLRGTDPRLSLFHHQGPPVEMDGRKWTKCPRCASLNTVSFQQLKDEGSTNQLWGLERIVKSNPKSFFEVKATSDAVSSQRAC